MLGSKIDNLFLLKKENVNVPNFIVIKHKDVLKKEICIFDLKGKNRKELKEVSEKLKNEVENNIQIKYENVLNCDLYSVRSSATLEDGNCASFAGQFDTYLNVSTDELNDKILDCFKSLYNVNVLEYMQKMDKNQVKYIRVNDKNTAVTKDGTTILSDGD